MIFRLRYLNHDFELPPGKFLIGRSTECQLSLDDPLVSRKHALLTVTEDFVEVADLGSRNGVQLNAEKIGLPRRVMIGDRITVGSQEMVLTTPGVAASPGLDPSTTIRIGHETMTNLEPVRTRADSVTREAGEGSTLRAETAKRDAFRLLGGVADKALALGRAEEAERLLSTVLGHVLQTLRSGGQLDASIIDQAGLYAARLASATAKGAWVDYVIELHFLAVRPCAGATVDELHSVVRKVKSVDLAGLRAYVKLLRDKSATFGPAERFLVQRIEGLERLVTLK
jgi:hypothetical protein